MPPWSPVEASVDVVCRLHQRINDVYDVNQIDVVVVGIFHQVSIPECHNRTSMQPRTRRLMHAVKGLICCTHACLFRAIDSSVYTRNAISVLT